MRIMFAALIALTLTACGKKVEAVPGPVNSQITDAVTQVMLPAETLDAGVLAPVSSVVPDPSPKPVEVQTVPETK